MRRRIVPAVATVVMAVLGIALATPATAKVPLARHDSRIATAKKRALALGAPASAVRSHDCYPISNVFESRYSENPAAWGCATSTTFQDYHGALAQEFENGEMVFSPGQGTNMVVSGYTYPNGNTQGIHFEWGTTDPFSYDTFLARINNSQEQCGDDHVNCYYPRIGGDGHLVTNAGYMDWPSTQTGYYTLTVEGYDQWDHSANQHWTSPVELFTFN